LRRGGIRRRSAKDEQFVVVEGSKLSPKIHHRERIAAISTTRRMVRCQNVEKFARKVAAVWKALGRRTDKLRFDRVKLLRDSFAQELRHRELGAFCTIPQLGKCRIGVTCCGSKIQRVLATVVQFPPADIPRGIS
jgi:hypothetical protein